MRVGVHTSIAGGVANAVREAKALGCDTFQMFSANPRGWRAAGLSPADCEQFRQERAGSGQFPVAIHANYLINLAAAGPQLRELSIAAYRREIERALELGADYLIVHPGSAKGTATAAAIRTAGESILEAARGLPLNGRHGLTLLIENTAGQGSTIGRRFEELAEILAVAGEDVPLGVCIDTAHCFAAGYAIHTPEGLASAVSQLDSAVGLARVRVIHSNDSKTEFGSEVDRHQHIGKGKIGREAFGRIVRHPGLREIPFICETPVDRPGDDKRNIAMMRRLGGMQKAASR